MICNSTLVHLLNHLTHPKVKSFLINVLAPQNSTFSIPSIIKSKLYNYLYIIKYSNAISNMVLSKDTRGVEVDAAKIELINQHILFVNKNINLINLYFEKIERPWAMEPLRSKIDIVNVDRIPENKKAFLIELKK
jgi:hypothetical protein